MTKILLPDINSTWGVRVRPDSVNTYKYAYSFNNLDDKIAFVEKVLLGGKKLPDELEKQYNKSFVRVDALKASFRIDKSNYVNKTDEFFLNKDICIVEKDGEYFFYAVLECTKMSKTIFQFTVELDIFFTYGHLPFFNKTETLIKRAHYDRWDKDKKPNLLLDSPMATSEEFDEMPTQPIAEKELTLAGIDGAILNTDPTEIAEAKKLIAKLQWKVTFLSENPNIIDSGKTPFFKVIGASYYAFAVPFINAEQDAQLSDFAAWDNIDPSNMAIMTPKDGTPVPNPKNTTDNSVATDIHYYCSSQITTAKLGTIILPSSTTLYPFNPFKNLTEGADFKPDNVVYNDLQFRFVPANSSTTSGMYLQVINPNINYGHFSVSVTSTPVTLALPNVKNFYGKPADINPLTTPLDNLEVDIKAPTSQNEKASYKTEAKLLTSPYTNYTLATGHTKYDYNMLYWFDKRYNNKIYFEIISNTQVKSRSVLFRLNVNQNDYTDITGYYKNGISNSKNFNDNTPFYFPTYSDDNTLWLEANSNQLQNKKSQLNWEEGLSIAGAVGGAIAAPFTGGTSLAAVGLAVGAIAGGVTGAVSASYAKQGIQAEIKDHANTPATVEATEFDLDILQETGNWLPKLYINRIFPQFLTIISNYFMQYGYTWTRFAKLDDALLKSRYWFNYVECEGCFENIILQVGNEVKNIINASFTEGITLYHVRRTANDELDYLNVKDFTKENMEMSLISNE